jgi:hypothetical protein
MTTLLDMVRHRRAQLETTGLEHLGPITDEDRERAIRQCIANAPHDPAQAELLRKVCAIAPEVEAWVKEIAVEMQAEAKTPAKMSAEPRLDALSRNLVKKHGGSIRSDKGR